MPKIYYVECYSNWPAKSRGYRTHKNIDGDNRDRLSAGMYWIAKVEAESAKEAIKKAKTGKEKIVMGQWSDPK
jgi:hypothetical protein